MTMDMLWSDVDQEQQEADQRRQQAAPPPSPQEIATQPSQFGSPFGQNQPPLPPSGPTQDTQPNPFSRGESLPNYNPQGGGMQGGASQFQTPQWGTAQGYPPDQLVQPQPGAGGGYTYSPYNPDGSGSNIGPPSLWVPQQPYAAQSWEGAPVPQPLPIEPGASQLNPGGPFAAPGATTYNYGQQASAAPPPPAQAMAGADTGILQQARDYSQANPGYQIPGGQNTNFLAGLAGAASYISGAPGRGVDELLPENTPGYIRTPLEIAANAAPMLALGGEGIIPLAARAAGLGATTYGFQQGEQQLERQGTITPGMAPYAQALANNIPWAGVPGIGVRGALGLTGGQLAGRQGDIALGIQGPGGQPGPLEQVAPMVGAGILTGLGRTEPARPAETPTTMEAGAATGARPEVAAEAVPPTRPPEAWEANKPIEAPRSTPTGMSPEETASYQAGYTTAMNDKTYGNPQYGWGDVGNGPQDNPLSNAHWAGVAAAQAEQAANPGIGRMQNEANVREGAFGQPNPFNEQPAPAPGFTNPTAGFRQPADALTLEGASGDVHNVLGYLGDRGGQPFYATDGGPVGGVPLSELAAHAIGPERAQLDQMRAGQGVPPTAQTQAAGPESAAAGQFRQSASGQAQAEQAAAGTNTPRQAAPRTGNAQADSVLRPLQELAYAPFGFDVGTALRQDVTRGLNPLRAAETKQVWGAAFEAAKSPEASRAINNEVQHLPHTEYLFNGKNPLHFADVEGTQGVAGRETTMSKALSWIPGYDNTWRANATVLNARRGYGLESFLENNPKVGVQQATQYAHYLERVTGRGSVPDALQPLGPLFTSLRFAASIPERLGYLLPVQRMPDGSIGFAGKVATEALKDHVGFIATVAATMALAEQAGAKVGWNPYQQSDDKEGNPGFGVIKGGPIHVDLLGGARQYITTAVQMATGEKNGRPYPVLAGEGPFGIQGSGAEFVRNKLGPALGLGFQGAKLAGVSGEGINFLRPDYWDQGLLGTGSTADRVAGNLTPLWMQDLANAIRETPGGFQEKATAGLVGGGLSFAGAGVTAYPPSASAQVTQSGTQVLADPAKLQQAFPNHPELAKILQGQKYSDLNSIEKNVVKAVLDPADLKALEDSNRKLSPAIAVHGDKLDQLRADRTSVENMLLDRLNSGQMSGQQIRDAMKVTKDEYAKGKEAADKDPAFQKELAALKEGAPQANRAQDVVDTFWAIDAGDPKKTSDARNQYIASIIKEDPDMGNRLLFAIEPRNQSNLQQLYSSAGPLITSVFSLPEGTARSDARRANPTTDAVLNFLGYESRTLTPQAEQILAGMRHR